MKCGYGTIYGLRMLLPGWIEPASGTQGPRTTLLPVYFELQSQNVAPSGQSTLEVLQKLKLNFFLLVSKFKSIDILFGMAAMPIPLLFRVCCNDDNLAWII